MWQAALSLDVITQNQTTHGNIVFSLQRAPCHCVCSTKHCTLRQAARVTMRRVPGSQ
jgi:hypothetical protein